MDTGLWINGFGPEEWMKWSPGVPKGNTGSFYLCSRRLWPVLLPKKNKKEVAIEEWGSGDMGRFWALQYTSYVD